MLKLRWLLFIFFIFSTSSLSAAELEFYFYRSPYGLEWDSPKKLLISTIENYMSGEAHIIGHVHIKLSCSSTASPVYSGMTMADSSEEGKLLLEDQVGLGIMFHNFKGKLEDSNEVEREVGQEVPTGRLNILRLKISETTCERLKTYYHDYKINDYGKNYGLTNRPLNKEGAGCTAFAFSYFQLAGFSDIEEFQKWSRQMRVPESLIGGGSTGRRIDLLEILFSPDSKRWANQNEPGRDIVFWDADLMYSWVDKLWNSKRKNIKYKKFMRGKSKGIYMDLSEIYTPDGEIWEN